MEYQLIAVEYRILKIICELDSVKVAGIRTELAEHAVTKVRTGCKLYTYSFHPHYA